MSASFVARKPGGLSDPRGNLFEEIVRVAKEARAPAILLENVPGMKSDSRVLPLVLRRLEEEGYSHTHEILDASDYGVPQRRKRLFVVAFLSGEMRDAFRFPAPTHGQDLPEPRVTVRQALSLGSRSYLAGGRIPGAKGWQGHRRIDVDSPSNTIGAGPNTDWICPKRGDAYRLRPHHTSILQGFPSEFRFSQNVHRAYRQIGNAVPPKLAEVVGAAIIKALSI